MDEELFWKFGSRCMENSVDARWLTMNRNKSQKVHFAEASKQKIELANSDDRG